MFAKLSFEMGLNADILLSILVAVFGLFKINIDSLFCISVLIYLM